VWCDWRGGVGCVCVPWGGGGQIGDVPPSPPVPCCAQMSLSESDRTQLHTTPPMHYGSPVNKSNPTHPSLLLLLLCCCCCCCCCCCSQVPQSCTGVPVDMLHPERQWSDKTEFNNTLINLGQMFMRNFEHFHDGERNTCAFFEQFFYRECCFSVYMSMLDYGMAIFGLNLGDFVTVGVECIVVFVSDYTSALAQSLFSALGCAVGHWCL